MGFREVGINRHIQPGRSAFDPAQHQMLHRIKANCAAFESTLYPGFNIRDLEDLQQSQNLNELTFALFIPAAFNIDRYGPIFALM